MTRVLAIDPGLAGGYALLVSGGFLIEAGDLPIVGEGAQRRVAAAGLANIVDRLSPDVAVMEAVASMPGQGVSGVFRFGRAVGTIEGVLIAREVPLQRVTPQVWKRRFGLLGKEKGSGEPSRQRAVERWPGAAAKFFSLKKHSHRAEAALIGLWFVETQGALREAA